MSLRFRFNELFTKKLLILAEHSSCCGQTFTRILPLKTILVFAGKLMVPTRLSLLQLSLMKWFDIISVLVLDSVLILPSVS